MSRLMDAACQLVEPQLQLAGGADGGRLLVAFAFKLEDEEEEAQATVPVYQLATSIVYFGGAFIIAHATKSSHR